MSVEKLKSDIISKIDIEHFYSQRLEKMPTAFETDGWSRKTLCPIHQDKETPNFAFNRLTGRFNCFACNASGSIFDFWILNNGLEVGSKQAFQSAIIELSKIAGIDLRRWAKENHISKPKTKDEKLNELKAVPQQSNIADAIDSANLPISSAVVKTFVDALTPDHIKFLNEKRGLTLPTISKAEIGWNPKWPIIDKETGKKDFGRFTIPVPNKSGQYRNIRGYSNRVDPAYKVVNYIVNKGKENEVRYGHPPRLYNLHRLIAENWEHVVICEGEFDCILLTQELHAAGLTNWGAVTSTHGVNKFQVEWLEYLEGKYIYICFDVDEKSKVVAPTIATQFFLDGIKKNKYKHVKLITLPLEGTKEDKDISDYFLKRGYNISNFISLCESTDKLIIGGVSSDEATVEPINIENFVEAIKSRAYIDKRIRVPIAIAGTTNRTYHAIRTYEIVGCPLKKEGECCNDGSGIQTIPYGHPIFIFACMQREDANLKEISRIACCKGQKCIVKPHEKVVMEEYYAHQVVSRWRAEEKDGHYVNTQELVQAPVYVLQPLKHIKIEPRNYMATGYIRTHPITSIATLFIETLEPLEEEWSEFKVDNINKEILIELKKYTTDQIIEFLVNNVTNIYDADEILYAVLLTFLSPIKFYFNNRVLRGWINTAIIGDSGTGKSATYARLSDYLEIGDLFSCLTGSRTGLLYAIKQRGNDWFISIGAYVRASGKIIALDEAQEIASEDIKRAAIAMDTGHLNIERVATGGFTTMTRAIFMLNPKDAFGKAATISDFTYGCESLKRCFDPMFIRRLDLAVFTTSSHKHEFYNKRNVTKESGGISITGRMLRSLIFWAWTRTIDNIKWNDDAVDQCLYRATELSGIYGYADLVPLVSPQDFRENLARLSTAYAVLCRNYDEQCENLIVEVKHVDSVCGLINMIYSSPACDLKSYSSVARLSNTLDDYEEIKTRMQQIIKMEANHVNPEISIKKLFLQLVLMIEQLELVRRRDIQEQLGVTNNYVNNKIIILRNFNLVKLDRFGVRKTRKFNLFMRAWRREDGIEEMLSNTLKTLSKNAENSIHKDMQHLHGEGFSTGSDDEFESEVIEKEKRRPYNYVKNLGSSQVPDAPW